METGILTKFSHKTTIIVSMHVVSKSNDYWASKVVFFHVHLTSKVHWDFAEIPTSDSKRQEGDSHMIAYKVIVCPMKTAKLLPYT